FEAAADLEVFILILDHRAAFLNRDIDVVRFLLGRLMQPDGKKSATKSDRQLARGLFANVEVLVEPAARWAEDAPFAPAKFDYFLAAAGGVGLGTALFRPKQSVAFRFENDDHRD